MSSAAAEPFVPPADSIEHFFKEHRWGYGTTRAGALMRYEVDHPVWSIYPLRSHALDFDFAGVYGPEWACLDGARPDSTVLAVGSDVRVLPGTEWVTREALPPGRQTDPDRSSIAAIRSKH